MFVGSTCVRCVLLKRLLLLFPVFPWLKTGKRVLDSCMLPAAATRDTFVSLEHRRSHKQHSYICSNSQQYTVWVKIIHFYFMPFRILRLCSMKIFSTFPIINISKLNFWLLICIAEILIWTSLKMIFSIFIFFCTLYINIIYSAFRWCIHLNFTKLTLMTGFVLQGHILCCCLSDNNNNIE